MWYIYSILRAWHVLLWSTQTGITRRHLEDIYLWALGYTRWILYMSIAGCYRSIAYTALGFLNFLLCIPGLIHALMSTAVKIALCGMWAPPTQTYLR